VSYHRDMLNNSGSATLIEVDEKTLDVEDTSRLARLAYRVVLQQVVDRAKVLRQLKSETAKEVGKAVLGSTKVDRDAIDVANRLKEWASRNAGIPLPPDPPQR
jgi:hypothetical protein